MSGKQAGFGAGVWTAVVAAAVAIFLTVLAGCGGSGGGNAPEITVRELYGRVVTTSNRPLASVIVAVTSTGESTSTGSDGSFSIISSRVASRYVFDLSGYGFASTVEVNDVPSETVSLQITFTMDLSGHRASVRRVEAQLQDGSIQIL